MTGLKLMALDASDLTVISAQVQDALTKPDLIDYAPAQKRFSLVLNRFAWDAKGNRARAKDGFERRRAVISFAQVLGVQSRGIRQGSNDQVLALLALRFVPDKAEAESPGGTIEMLFANDVSIRLTVEAIEAQLADTGGAWTAKFKPRHPTS